MLSGGFVSRSTNSQKERQQVKPFLWAVKNEHRRNHGAFAHRGIGSGSA